MKCKFYRLKFYFFLMNEILVYKPFENLGVTILNFIGTISNIVRLRHSKPNKTKFKLIINRN